jgi:hypothetical protein
MATLHVETERTVQADPATVFGLVSDYAEGRPRYLPPNYAGYEVEEGGRGAGTTVRYVLHAARRERPYRMQVTQPDAGLVVVEKDAGSSLTTTWTVVPGADGKRSTVRLVSEWEGAGGVGGFFERLFAPGGLRRIHDDTLARLAKVAEAG